MNHTELRLWACLRGRQVDGWKFRRQQPIGPYYVDFYCPAARLVIEVNGPAHDGDERWKRDQSRYAWLERHGYRVLEIVVQDIDRDMNDVLDRIHAELLRPHPPASPGTSPQSGED